MEKLYKTVDSKKLLKELADYIENSDIIAFDTETNSLNTRKGSIIGWSVTSKEGTGYYLPTKEYDPENDELVDLYIENELKSEIASETLLPLLKGKKLVMHNGSFDCRFVKNYYGIDLIDSLWVETTLLYHTINEEGVGIGGSFRLKDIAIEVQDKLNLNVEEEANKEQIELKESIKSNGGSVTKKLFEIHKADLSVLSKYAAADTDITFRICKYYLPQLKEEGLEKFFFEEEVMPVYKEVTIPMETIGVDLDLDLMNNTYSEISKDIEDLKKEVQDELLALSEFKRWAVDTAISKYPPKKTGNFAQELVSINNIDLPKSPKTGKFSLSKKNVEAIEGHEVVKEFLLTGDEGLLSDDGKLEVSMNLYKKENNGNLINIGSKKQLSELLFDYLKEEPLSKTDKGVNQFNEDTIKHFSGKYKWANKLRIFNKLMKIKSTYIERILNNQEDGKYYFYFKQHGTLSGRYGSDAQQIPKPMEDGEDENIIVKYNNRLRAFMIAGEGKKVIDSDYESLEPHCFASVSGDEALRDIFRKGHDFYSTVAIKTEGLEGVSADKKADDYLKKVDPVKRQKAKAYSLGVAYGMESYALHLQLDVPQKEAEKLISGYLKGFPQLKEWMDRSRKQAKEEGKVVSYLGRVRHLSKVKEIYDNLGDSILDWRYRAELAKKYGKDKVIEVYRDYKNGLNNCLNFQLQSLSASVVNRSALAINRKAKELGINAVVQAQVHDQLIINIDEKYCEVFAPYVQHIMENIVDLPGITLKAPPEIADNWRDGH